MAHWFQPGEPGYLYRLLMAKQAKPLQLENCVMDADFVTKFELETFRIEALLFQCGYLTISRKEVLGSRIQYYLDYPNFEVQSSFNLGLTEHLTGCGEIVAKARESLIEALGKTDFQAFREDLERLLWGIPGEWHATGNLARYESWYASLLYMSFRTTRIDLVAEESASHGWSDMVLQHAGRVFMLEFKMEEEDTKTEAVLDRAIAQMRKGGMPRSTGPAGTPDRHGVWRGKTQPPGHAGRGTVIC